jgi:Tat protein translocase TatB subunit
LYLFIFENFGTQELLLVGVVALILLGPRKMPEMARKIGKMMSEFRGTANEFKETWQREINFEEEAKALDINTVEAETVKRVESIKVSETTVAPVEPLIKPVDPAAFADLEDLQRSEPKQADNIQVENQPKLPLDNTDTAKPAAADANDKKNWL